MEENLTNRGRIRADSAVKGMGGNGEGMENLFLKECRFALISPQLEGNMATSKHEETREDNMIHSIGVNVTFKQCEGDYIDVFTENGEKG